MKRSRIWLLVALLTLAVGFYGCSGDDGSNGAPGATGAQGDQGPAGPVTTTNESCNICHGDLKPFNVTNFAAHDSAPYTPNYTVAVDDVQFIDTNADSLANEGLTVTFTVTDGNGAPVDLATDVVPAVTSVSLNLSKLVQSGTSTVYNWQNYYNTSATGATTIGGEAFIPALASAIQAGSAKCTPAATATPGQYTCSVDSDFTNVTTPLAVPFDGSLTHRVAVFFGSHLDAGYPGTAMPTSSRLPSSAAAPLPRLRPRS